MHRKRERERAVEEEDLFKVNCAEEASVPV
jgi:hypothetical protein